MRDTGCGCRMPDGGNDVGYYHAVHIGVTGGLLSKCCSQAETSASRLGMANQLLDNVPKQNARLVSCAIQIGTDCREPQATSRTQPSLGLCGARYVCQCLRRVVGEARVVPPCLAGRHLGHLGPWPCGDSQSQARDSAVRVLRLAVSSLGLAGPVPVHLDCNRSMPLLGRRASARVVRPWQTWAGAEQSTRQIRSGDCPSELRHDAHQPVAPSLCMPMSNIERQR